MKDYKAILKKLKETPECELFKASIEYLFYMDLICDDFKTVENYQIKKDINNDPMVEEPNALRTSKGLMYATHDIDDFWNGMLNISYSEGFCDTLVSYNEEVTAGTIHKMSLIDTYINKAFNKIKESTETDKFIVFFKVILDDDVQTMSELVTQELKPLIAQNFIKEKALKLTSTSFLLGEICIKYFLIKLIPILEKVILETSDEPDDSIIFTKNESETLQILKDIFLKDNNDTECFHFWETLDKNLTKNFITNKVFIKEVLNVTLKNQLRIHGSKDNIPRSQSNNVLCVKLGALLLDLLTENDKEEPNMFLKEEKNISFKNNTRKTFVLTLSNSLSQETIFDLYQYDKPYLSPSNLSYLANNKNPILNAFSKAFNNTIHENPNIKMTIADKYKKDVKKLKTKYSIDEVALGSLLEILLETLKNKNAYFDNADNLVSLVNFVKAFYQIDLNKIYKNYLNLFKNNKSEVTACLEVFSKFLTDFDYVDAARVKPLLEGLITKSELSQREKMRLKIIVIKDLYKFAQKKLYLVGFLTNAIKYSSYKHFYMDTFLDSRGRVYYRNIFLNIQTVVMARAILKVTPFTWKKKESYDYLFTTVEGILKSAQAKKMVKQYMSQQNHIIDATNRKLIHRNILNDLKISDPILKHEFEEILNNKTNKSSTELFKMVVDSCPKIKNILLVFSSMRSEIDRTKYPNKIRTTASYYSCDASASGVQMQSILLYDKKLAFFSNILGNKDQDLYKHMAELLKKHILVLQDQGIIFKKFCFNIGWDWDKTIVQRVAEEPLFIFSEKYMRANTLRDYLQLLCECNFVKSPASVDLIDNILAQNVTNNSLGELLQTTEKLLMDYTFIIEPLEIKQLKETFVHDDFTKALCLLLLRYFYKFYVLGYTYEYLAGYSDFWNQRELPKKLAMTSQYGATSFGRKKNIEEALKEKIEKPSASSYISYHNDIFFACKLINAMFENVMSVNLKSHLSTFLSILVDKKEPIKIKNQFVHITIQPLETKSIQIQLSSHGKNRGSQVRFRQQTSNMNYRKMKSFILANIAHSMDAFILHMTENIVRKVNVFFNKESIQITHIHDSFFINFPLLLKPILVDSYWHLINLNYISTITNLKVPDIYRCLLDKNPDPIINPIRDKFHKAIENMRKKNLTPEQSKQALEELEQALEEAINKELTPFIDAWKKQYIDGIMHYNGINPYFMK